jgi:hypothetical protein
VDPQDFLDRAEMLAACGLPVLVSDFSEYYRLAAYLTKMTQEPIGIALGIKRLRALFNEQAFGDLPGGILEAFGRLFKGQLKLFVYPSRDAVTGEVTTLGSMQLEGALGKLFAYLYERGSFVELKDYSPECLAIYAHRVLDSIVSKQPDWREKVPSQTIDLIEGHRLFAH